MAIPEGILLNTANEDALPGGVRYGGPFAFQKPPLGAMPEHVWKEKRVADLARAVHEYVQARQSGEQCVKDWLDELLRLL